ncbi:UDP-N-acetylmuramate dehydrogenase [Seongchinamella sediminis]|uniref:UDP-N-acetylenolpyruvoylglucosamine reductase n=1 Tax=Seongchinamella sediminis TaxID=2283635 RepID=A0A3L7E0Q9_9GAMM|nr:UDP-N-acetylmuramate dehydrogenase [Seongchinamella sediminis]RLQ23084.1 UDP-N-acetylmuramate dehydrogenase [Seongchinamella sediminis]
MQILRAESLRARNTLHLESHAKALVEVSSGAQLSAALDWARAEGLPVLPLGSGSNVVLAGDIDALVVCQRGSAIDVLSEQGDSVMLRVAAGHDWHALVEQSLARGYYGLENLALIPGTVGAAPIQNIGAYGVELERFVAAVHAVETASGRALTLSAGDCGFAYRDSVFKRELRDKLVITAVDLRLSRRPAPELAYPALRSELERAGIRDPGPEDVFRAVVAVRSRRLPDPAREPNVGSFFKNPVVAAAVAAALQEQYPDMPLYPQADGGAKVPAAWLIERAGWKGRRRGGVGVHPGHALVLVNYGSDAGADILALAEEIRAAVASRFTIALEPEPRIYGDQA